MPARIGRYWRVEIGSTFDCLHHRRAPLVERTLAPLFGAPESEDCRRAARILWSALHGIASLALAQKLERLARLSAEEMADDLVTTYFAGLTAQRDS